MIYAGGRQVDGAIPSLYALEQIMKSEKIRTAQRCGVLTVLFDSGIRTGSDIIKAIALGAQAVLRTPLPRLLPYWILLTEYVMHTFLFHDSRPTVRVRKCLGRPSRCRAGH